MGYVDLPDAVELSLAAYGALSIIWTIYRLGQVSGKRRRRRNKKPTTNVVKLRTRDEVSRALANEINKGRKGNPDKVEQLVRMQNEFRKLAS